MKTFIKYVLVLGLLASIIESCGVQLHTVKCKSTIRVPVVIETVLPDSTKRYETVMLPYCDTTTIVLKNKNKNQ